MNVSINEVYSFKLSSGEELITKVVGIGEDHLMVNEPVSVAPGPQGLGLVPSMFTAKHDGEFRLNKSSITIYGLTDEAVKNKYIEATGQIVIPSKKLILG
jgi:hypothetical protein